MDASANHHHRKDPEKLPTSKKGLKTGNHDDDEYIPSPNPCTHRERPTRTQTQCTRAQLPKDSPPLLSRAHSRMIRNGGTMNTICSVKGSVWLTLS
jgi:hypothetical protein